MPYILDAKSASLLAAGVPKNQDDRAIQQHLALIETAIRHSATNGYNRVPLLGEKFAGWDKNDILTGPLFMSQVFEALAEAGYSFHTKSELEITCESGPHRIPYPHTVVTWPKATISPQVVTGSAPRCPDDEIAEGFRGAGKTELLTQEAKDLLEGVFPPTTLPAPGTPTQLIEYLRQKGYKMQGFGCLVEVKHKPTNWDTCRALGSLVLNLLEVHRSGSPKEPTTASLPLKDYPEIDFKYLRGTFAEVGLLVHQKGDTIECRWPVSAWDYFEPAPMPALSTPAMLPLPREKSFPAPVSRIGKFVVALRQAGFDVASSKDMLPQDLLALEKFEDDPETGKAYENVLECLLEAVKRGDSELQMCLSIDCKIGGIAQYLRPLGFSGDCTVHAHPGGSIGPHALLILKWSAIK